MAVLSLVSVKTVAAAGLQTQQQKQQQQQRGVQRGMIFKSEGLSLPSDRMALKSAFNNGGGGGGGFGLLMIGSQGVDASLTAMRSRVTMKVAATKGAYICRDCGFLPNFSVKKIPKAPKWDPSSFISRMYFILKKFTSFETENAASEELHHNT